MYNDNNKKLKTILLVLAIVLVLLRIVKTAKADTISDAHVYFDDYFYNYPLDSWNWFSSNCNQFIVYDVVNNNVHYKVLEGYNTSGVFNTHIPSNNYWYQSYATFASDGRLVQASSYDVTPKGFYIINDGHNNYRQWGFQTATSATPWSWQGDNIFTTASYDYFGTNTSFVSGGWYLDFSDYYASADIYVDSGNGTYVLKESNAISYTEDDRLKIYKLWSTVDGDSLVLDMTDFRGAYTAAIGDTISNVSVTLTINGEDIEYPLSASTSTITDNWSSNSTLYTLSTPYSHFTLSDTYNVYVSKVSFTHTRSSAGGSFSENMYISTNYLMYLNQSAITPAAVPTPATVYDDPAKPIDISDRQYDLFQQLQSSVSGGEVDFVSNYPVVPTWANVYQLNTFFYDSTLDNLHIYLGSQITGAYRASTYAFDLKAFIYDNAHSQFYDVIIIRVDDTDWPMIVDGNSVPDSQELYGYVVLYTQSYYMRLDAETQINILEAIQLDANQQLSNWTWLVGKMDDFEDKTLQVLNPIYDETKYMDDKLASILYAVNHLDFPVFDDSSLVSGISSVVAALSGDDDDLGVNGRLDKLINFFVANEAERNDSALTYRNWLDGLDPTESRRVTHFGTNIYSLVKNIFDIFDADYTEDPSFENPDKDYLGIASDYIDALNNRNNTNKFFRGFFDSSFDPLEQSGLPEE